MQDEGVSPDVANFMLISKACCNIGYDIEFVKKIHHEVSKQGLLEKDIALGTALLNTYRKWEVFDRLWIRHLLAWNALITVYTRVGNVIIFELF
jgi:hypothetical protein